VKNPWMKRPSNSWLGNLDSNCLLKHSTARKKLIKNPSFKLNDDDFYTLIDE